MTDADRRALRVIINYGGISCATLGEKLWGRPGLGSCSCPWARPAGCVIKRLMTAGLVRRRNDPDRFLYEATYKGKREAI
jgi:hypothetical protein